MKETWESIAARSSATTWEQDAATKRRHGSTQRYGEPDSHHERRVRDQEHKRGRSAVMRRGLVSLELAGESFEQAWEVVGS